MLYKEEIRKLIKEEKELLMSFLPSHLKEEKFLQSLNKKGLVRRLIESNNSLAISVAIKLGVFSLTGQQTSYNMEGKT